VFLTIIHTLPNQPFGKIETFTYLYTMPIQKVTKIQIIEIARQVFTKQGYHHSSMNDIAEASGIQKGSLYHHFSGKEELMIAAIDSFHQQFKEGAFSAFSPTI